MRCATKGYFPSRRKINKKNSLIKIISIENSHGCALKISRSKSSCSLYVQKSFRNKEGISTSKIVERLGSLEEIRAGAGGRDPMEWAREYVARLTEDGYVPNYTGTDLTDGLHEKAGFRTDTEIVTNQKMRQIIRDIKNVKYYEPIVGATNLTPE